jgi:CubicO group peptidase (beta-lactamase class C family)
MAKQNIKMKNLVVILFLFFSCSAIPQSVTEKLDELVSAYAKLNKFNGSVLVAQKGKVLLEKGYGWKNKKDSLFTSAATVYQIGSVTKQFTAAIILRLEEQGKLRLDDKLTKYFPGYPNGDSITIFHLLTHSSGIFNYTNDGKFMNAEVARPQTQEKMISLFRDKPLGFSPGSKFSYSNSGYSLLGYIVEKVTGKQWETVMREYILSPLKMTHSGFDFARLQSPDKAIGYFYVNSTGYQTAPIVDSTVSYAAGSLYSTVGDLYKWERAIYGDKILKPGSWKKAFTPFKSKYGFGWIMDTVETKPITWHNGGIHGFSSHLQRYPQSEAVVILLTNRPSPELGTIANSIGALLHNQPYTIPAARKEITLPAETLQQYVGVYALSETETVTMTLENGQLKTQITGQPKFDLFAEKQDQFFLKVVDAVVTFSRGTDGKVTEMVISQNGRNTKAKKIQ